MNDPSRVLVYIASPLADNQTYWTRQAIRAADDIYMNTGATPYVAVLSILWDFLSPKDYSFWLRYCINILLRCDVVYRVCGKSTGATIETIVAKEVGIPVVYTIPQLVEVMKTLSLDDRLLKRYDKYADFEFYLETNSQLTTEGD